MGTLGSSQERELTQVSTCTSRSWQQELRQCNTCYTHMYVREVTLYQLLAFVCAQTHIKVFEEILQVSKELVNGRFLPINAEPRQELTVGSVHQFVLLLHACELALSVTQELLHGEMRVRYDHTARWWKTNTSLHIHTHTCTHTPHINTHIIPTGHLTFIFS